MAKRETSADRLRRLRKTEGFAPIWTKHGEQRRSEYDFDKLSIERIVRSGAVRPGELDIHGREQVHVSGNADGEPVDVVVEVAVAEADGTEIVRIVTLKPKNKQQRSLR